MKDIGCVEYEKTEAGIMTARWFYLRDGETLSGTGAASGGPTAGFAGEYEITYYDGDQKKMAHYQLSISGESGFFKLEWKSGGQTEYWGIGIQDSNKLYASWRKVED